MNLLPHWDGGPDCGELCTGSHFGDHLIGLICQGCGGSAYGCYQATSGNGCSEPGPRKPQRGKAPQYGEVTA